MTAAEIAAALGAARRSGGWWRCLCPAHSSRGATLAIRDGDRGLIAKCFAGCDRRDVLAALKQRLLIGYTGAGNGTFRHFAGRASDDVARIVAARRMWDRAREAVGTPVAAYLAGRGVSIPPPRSLRWAPSLRRLDGSFAPAMVAIVEHVERNIVGGHRTWLARDPAGNWQRLYRATLGPIGGGAVRLALAGELLMIGEGIETCLAAMQATGLPAWAALSTSGMVALVLPPLPRDATVVILADHDANGAGERAAQAAAARWLAEGRRVRIAMPPEPGSDFNDVLMGRAYARITEPNHAGA
jgi:hypothetical protein